MTPRILLTGKNGQVGFELQRALAPLGAVVACDRVACDLADPASIRAAIAEARPDIIVNSAAYTAVDRAEADADAARAVNGDALDVIGREARRIDALVVHYSTDYVFDGTKDAPYVEDDEPNPVGIYGKTKLAGESALRASGARSIILRTSWVFGAHGTNFVKTILRLAREREELKIVADQFGAPTSASLIADVTARILHRQPDAQGIYHLTASGVTSWQAFAVEILTQATAAGHSFKAPPETIRAIPTSAYPLPAARPANSRLETRRLREAFALELPDWRSGLRHVLAQILR